MKSREDCAYIVGRDGDTDAVIRNIAVSLGRIADMLAEMNHYYVDCDAGLVDERERRRDEAN